MNVSVIINNYNYLNDVNQAIESSQYPLNGKHS